MVNAGPDLTVSLPNNATLNGTVTDDGLPPGSTLTITWSKVSGPGTVTFVNASAASTTASFSAAGSYVLRLTASDGEFTVSDEASITVLRANNAPTANAGLDQAGVVGSLVTLDGSASSDLDGDALTYAWSITNRPPGSLAVLANPTTVNPSFTPDAAGLYDVQLIVNDGQASSIPDHVGITVTPLGPPLILQNVMVGKDLQTTASVSLGAPAPAGGLLVTLVSNSPDVLLATNGTTVGAGTATVPVAPGVTGGTFFIQGLTANGTGQITASAPGYTGGSSTVTLTPSGFSVVSPGDFTTTTVSPNTSVRVGSYRLNPTLTVAQNQPLRAGLNGVAVDVTSSNTGVGTITISPVIFNQNDVNVGTAFDPAAAGQTTITVGTPAGFSTPTLTSIVATVTAPSLTIANLSVGKDLQTAQAVFLGAPAPARGVQVTLVSNSPDILLAANGTTVGTGTVTITVPATQTSGSFFVQGLAASGTGQLSASAPSYANGSATVTLTPSGFSVVSPGDFTTTTLSPNTSVRVGSYRLNPALTVAQNQPLRAGLNGVAVDVTSSNTDVGTITISPVIFNQNEVNVGTAFDPAAAGQTTITVGTPAGFSTPTLTSIVATVTAPSLTIANLSVGKDLQTAQAVFLGAPAPAGGVQVTLVSNSPDVLLAANGTTVGTGTVTITVPAGQSSGSFFVQGLAASGTGQLSASAPGYANGNTAVTLTPSGFAITFPGSFTTTTVAANTTVQISSYRLTPATLAPAQNQPLRAGLNGLGVDVTSSNTGVGTITISPVIFNQNVVSVNTAFDPAGVGTATITVGTPAGFFTPASLRSIVATVN